MADGRFLLRTVLVSRSRLRGNLKDGLGGLRAKDSEVRVVIAKRESALLYLRDHLPVSVCIRNWFWVTHGHVGFGNMERARRLLDQNGIEFVGRRLKSLG